MTNTAEMDDLFGDGSSERAGAHPRSGAEGGESANRDLDESTLAIWLRLYFENPTPEGFRQAAAAANMEAVQFWEAIRAAKGHQSSAY